MSKIARSGFLAQRRAKSESGRRCGDRRPGLKLDGMTPTHTVLHLHLHLHASEVRARRTRRLTDRPAYWRACREADLAHYADLMSMAARADDPHLRTALTRIAARAREEIDDSIHAARVIDDALKVAVERVAARQIRQARSNGEAPRLKVGWAKAK